MKLRWVLLTAGCVAMAWSGLLVDSGGARADGPTIVAIHFGEPEDVPITGDWTGSGEAQIGVYRPSDETFFLGDVDGQAPVAMPFGESNDVPVTGDWNGSGKTQIGVWRPSTATWYLGDVGGVPQSSVVFGQTGDVPITGDWTGSGITQLGVYDPDTFMFYLREVPPSAAPRPPPVVTTPVTTPIPTPSKGNGRRRRVRARITISWTWNHGRTRIHEVAVTRLPRRARITLRCTGRGCPVKVRSAKAAHVSVFAHRLVGTTYRPGDRLLITVSAPGLVTERARVTIRDNRKPLVAAL